MAETGCYLYGIIKSEKRIEFGRIGIPGGDPLVYTVHYRSLAACISNYPVDAFIKADTEHCRAHERVLETMMQRFTLLPFEFGIVAPKEEDVVKLLSRNRTTILLSLKRLQGKLEVSVKGFWKSLEAAAQEVLKEHPTIAHYRKEIASKPPEGTFQDRIRIGEMIAKALAEKRRREAMSLVSPLKRFAVDTQLDSTYGDTMVFSASFLIRKNDFSKFEKALYALGKRHERRVDFKYMGPMPPYSFTGVALKV